MWAPLCLLLVATLLSQVAPAASEDPSFTTLTKGRHQEFAYSYGSPIYLSYAISDFDARIDITMWATKDSTITGEVCLDESFRDASCFDTILPHTTTTLTLPVDLNEEQMDTILPIYIKIQGTARVTDEVVSVYISDGFYLADGVSSNTSFYTRFIGNTRYYKFFVCDSDENVHMKLKVYDNDVLEGVTVYAARDVDVPEPGATSCSADSAKCLIAVDTLTQAENEWDMDATNFDQPGWLIVAVTAAQPEYQNALALRLENMDYTAVYPNKGYEDPAVTADLCMYESCTANFIYTADTTKSLAVSTWNDNRDFMLRLPPHIAGNLSKGPKSNDKFQSSNGVLYITETEMADYFSDEESVELYFSVNNQYAITYPSLGASVTSPIKFGICQGCSPIYPHGSKYLFQGTKETMSRGRFIIPFAYDMRKQPIYTNTGGRTNTDPESPFRPSYAFMFRNYKASNNSNEQSGLGLGLGDGKTINKCPWEFLISTTYSERTQAIEETYFDAIIAESSAGSGGAGYEITPSSVSMRTAPAGWNPTDDERYYYREEMTVFGHMYPHDFAGSPNTCINDVNYLYVGDIYEMNPAILYGADSGMETEITFTTSKRSSDGYYPLHIKVTLTDDLTAADAQNFVITVTPRDETVASILIVGSPNVYLPDPEYDSSVEGNIVSNNGYYCASPSVSVKGSKFQGKAAIYFTIDFLASSTVTVTFSREDQVDYMTQGFANTDIKFKTTEQVFSVQFDSTVNGFEDGFFAAVITNSDDENTHHGAKFCVNSDPTTKPSANCVDSDPKNKLEIYTVYGSDGKLNNSKRMGTLVKGLSTAMESSPSYVRLMPHSGYPNDDSEATITAMFGVSRELDGSDIENDVQLFKFDNRLMPMYFEMKFNSTQDGRVVISPVGDLSDSSNNAWKLSLSICKDFPRLYKDEKDGLQCQSISFGPNSVSTNKIYFEMGNNKMLPSSGGTSTLWGSIFATNVVSGGQVKVDFSQSTYLDETKNNKITLQGNNYIYGFGTIPKLTNDAGAGNVKSIRYIVGISDGLSGATGDMYMSQTEIHPTSQTESGKKYSWPSENVFTLEVTNSDTTKMDRVYLSFRCTSCGPTDSKTIYVNVNLVYDLDFDKDSPLTYHPTVSSDKPLVTFYDVTSDFEFNVPHNAVSYFFYPYNTSDTTINTEEDFNKLSNYAVMGGSNINEVNSRNTSLNKYKVSGKGILPMTIPKNAVSKDYDDNYRMYFSTWKSADSADSSGSVVTTVFGLEDTSFTLDPNAPLDDSILKGHPDRYVPILFNYKANSQVKSLKIKVETCALYPLSSGSHKFCYSKFVHNPGPQGTSDNFQSEGCVDLGDKDTPLTLDRTEDISSGLNVFYGIHAGVNSSYRITTILDNKRSPIEIANKQIGHTTFEKSKYVILKVNPAYASENGSMAFTPLYIYYFQSSRSELSHVNSCGYEQSGIQPRIFSAEDVKALYDKSMQEEDVNSRGLIPLNFTLSELNDDVEYYVDVVAVHGNFKEAYSAIKVIPNRSIEGLDVTPEPDLWYVWLIVALVVIAAVVIVVLYLFIWRPRAEEKKQYQELDERNEEKAEAIAIEDDNNEPLA